MFMAGILKCVSVSFSTAGKSFECVDQLLNKNSFTLMKIPIRPVIAHLSRLTVQDCHHHSHHFDLTQQKYNLRLGFGLQFGSTSPVQLGRVSKTWDVGWSVQQRNAKSVEYSSKVKDPDYTDSGSQTVVQVSQKKPSLRQNANSSLIKVRRATHLPTVPPPPHPNIWVTA